MRRAAHADQREAGRDEAREDALPEAQRNVVAAVHLRGETYEEAASSTGTPLGTLKRQLRDGLASLRRTLEAGP